MDTIKTWAAIFSLSLFGLVFQTSLVWAEDTEDKPKLGNIGGSMRVGSNSSNQSNSIDYVGADSFGEKSNAISGSVSRAGDKWVARLFNNTDDTYSVSAEVVQYDANKRRIGTSSISKTLRGKESYTQEISTRATDCMLNLTRVKNLSPKRKEEMKDGSTEDQG